MPSDSIDGLKQELKGAISALVQPIRGLEDLTKVSLSPEALASVQSELSRHKRRKELLEAGLSSLDALQNATATLVADGYPEPLVIEVPQAVSDELIGQQADLEAAFSQFKPEPRAVGGTISLGTPVDNP